MSDKNLENLYRFEGAGTFISGTSSPSAAFNAGAVNIDLVDVGLVPGDVVSASAEIRNVASGDNVRLELRFFDGLGGTGSIVSTVTNTYANLTTFTRVTIPNVTIPATSQSMHMFIRRQGGTGTIEGHKGMINRGSQAAPYARPWRGSTFTPLPLWALGYSRVVIQPVELDSMFVPFGQRPRTQEYNAGLSDYWEANYQTLIEEAVDGRRLAAWARGVGLHGLVALRDPLMLDPGDDGTRVKMHNGRVNGAGQAGQATVTTDTWPASTLIVSAGDFIEISQRYYMAREDVESDGSGDAVIPIWPNLLSALDDDLVHVNTPHLHSMLLTVPPLDYFTANIVQRFSMAFREDK